VKRNPKTAGGDNETDEKGAGGGKQVVDGSGSQRVS